MFYLHPPLILEYRRIQVRLLTCLTAQQKGTTAQWYSNKTSLVEVKVVPNLNRA